MSAGNWLRAALMAAWTSRAAALMSRLRSNCSVTPVLPRPLEEVICVTPAIRPNWRSRGVATEEAIVSGLAPGRPEPTEIVGKSTCGRGATGKKRNATTPESRIAAVINDVATGRRMKGAEKLEEIWSTESNPRAPALRSDCQHETGSACRANQMQDKQQAWCRASKAG